MMQPTGRSAMTDVTLQWIRYTLAAAIVAAAVACGGSDTPTAPDPPSTGGGGSSGVSDSATMTLTTAQMLDNAYLAERAKLIDMKKAQVPGSGHVPRDGGTVYLTTADEKGMMFSYIQSNYMGFGSGVVVPGTGISLQNRGAGFTLERGHANEVGPRKRPFQTIIPGFLTRDG